MKTTLTLVFWYELCLSCGKEFGATGSHRAAMPVSPKRCPHCKRPVR
jgi:DNA-directed RNA polymerase subunit RPC12/RpoP